MTPARPIPGLGPEVKDGEWICMKLKLLIVLMLWALLALAGCAPSGYYGYQSYGYPPSPPVGGPGIGVSPRFYNYDPNLQQWYEPPYFNPYMH